MALRLRRNRSWARGLLRVYRWGPALSLKQKLSTHSMFLGKHRHWSCTETRDQFRRVSTTEGRDLLYSAGEGIGLAIPDPFCRGKYSEVYSEGQELKNWHIGGGSLEKMTPR